MREIVFRGHNGQHPLVVSDEDGLRTLRFGTEERQSCLDLHRPWVLQLEYTRWMMTALLLYPDPRRLLLLGLGGGGMAHFLLHHHPEAMLEVVEQDAHILDLARTWFALPESNRLRLIHREATAFFTEAYGCAWDLIFVDIFGPGTMAPPLFDPAFYRAILDRLSPDGVVAVNLWSGEQVLFDQARTALQQASRGQLVEMQVQRRGNAILLAFPGPIPTTRIKQAHKQASLQQRRYGIDCPRFLKRLRRTNRFAILHRLFR